MVNKFYKSALFTSILTFVFWGIIFVTDASYPNIIFKIFLPLGLLMLFMSLVLLFLSYIFDIKDDIKNKNYIGAIICAIGLTLVILNFFIKIR